jgi:histidinol-phosphate aminotransferase
MKTNLSAVSPRRVTTTALLALALLSPSLAFAGKPLINDGNTRISSNENPYGFTPKALARMKDAIDSGNYYNHDEVDEMVKLCAAKEGLPTNYILPTPGSGPVLMMAAWAYAKPGVNVVTTDTGYGQLVGAFKAHGGDVKYAPLNDKMGYDFKALGKLIDANTAIVYICNPNNPTGNLADPNELRNFIMTVPETAVVFVDEAYLELSDAGLKTTTMASLVNVKKNLIVSRTFSKAHAMAGLRAGYAMGQPAVLDKIREYYQGSMSSIAAIAAEESIKDTAHMEENRKHYQEVRKYVTAEFDKMGVKYAPNPQGAFIYFKPGKGLKGMDVNTKMKQSNILIGSTRESGVPEGTYSEWVRVSIGTKEDMDLFLGELSKALGKT